MNLASLTVALRPRTAWEAVELGTALVRRHAAAIWTPWLLLTLPLLVLSNLLAWQLDALWLAPLLMWWLKPLFDRIPLYVLSHAAFGDVPGTARTLRAQLRWGLRWMPAYLSWRRLSPVRALNLPVDLLEGARGTAARQRRRTLVGPSYGVALLVTTICLHFELAVYVGVNALAALFIPPEYLPEAWRDFLTVMREQPLWVELVSNALAWLATCAIEPFYVGAGFGLYLNRRTEIEGWDIEIVLRRLTARLARAGAPLLLGLALGGGLWLGGGLLSPAQAQDDASVEEADDASDKNPPEPTLPQVFDRLADDASLRKAVERAYESPEVSPKRTVTRWQPRDRDKPEKQNDPTHSDTPLLKTIGTIIALLGKYGLWLLLGVLVILLAATAPRWIGWLRRATVVHREPEPVVHEDLPEEVPLPDDIPTAVRQLWRDGHHRDALALLYRASVEAMSARAGVVLVPGATEAACLRASRQMPEPGDREAFAAMVRLWQYAAYADRLPDTAAFEQQLATLADCFDWSRHRPTVAIPPGGEA